jgi:hypothetical protein
MVAVRREKDLNSRVVGVGYTEQERMCIGQVAPDLSLFVYDSVAV